MRILTALWLGLWVTATVAEEDSFSDRVRQAMKADIRTEAERDRDRNRRPVETLEFFGLREDMRVLELIPGGGWYTKLLAPALKDSGTLYVGIGTARVQRDLLKQPGFEAVEVIAEDVQLTRREGSRFRDVEPFSFGVSDLDAVLTFRNMHNLTAEGRKNMNQAVFEALKPGGVFGVIDHTRRHMQADDSENRRRLDPVLVIQELLDAGFEMVDYSSLHYRPDDELRYEVGRRTVTGNTDRFTLLFRKPE